jgi:hypothetical protein
MYPICAQVGEKSNVGDGGLEPLPFLCKTEALENQVLLEASRMPPSLVAPPPFDIRPLVWLTETRMG